MTDGTDLETIRGLKKLQETIQELIDRSQNSLNESKKIQEKNNSIRDQISKIVAIDESIVLLGGYGGFKQLLNSLNTAQGMVEQFNDRYNLFSNSLNETLNIIQNLKADLPDQTDTTDIKYDEIETANLDSPEFLAPNQSDVQSIRSFTESLVRLGLATEASSIIETIHSISPIREDLAEQQRSLIEQLTQAAIYSQDLQQVREEINSIYQQAQGISARYNDYLSHFRLIEAAVQANADQAVQSQRAIVEHRTSIEASVQSNTAQIAQAESSFGESQRQIEEKFQEVCRRTESVQSLHDEVCLQRDSINQRIESVEKNLNLFQQKYQVIIANTQTINRENEEALEHLQQFEEIRNELIQINQEIRDYHHNFQQTQQACEELRHIYNQFLERYRNFSQQVNQVNQIRQSVSQQYDGILIRLGEIQQLYINSSNHLQEIQNIRSSIESLNLLIGNNYSEINQLIAQFRTDFSQVRTDVDQIISIRESLTTLASQVDNRHRECQEISQSLSSEIKQLNETLEEGRNLQNLVPAIDEKSQEVSNMYHSMVVLSRQLGSQQLIDKLCSEIQAGARNVQVAENSLNDVKDLHDKTKKIHTEIIEQATRMEGMILQQNSSLGKIERLTIGFTSLEDLVNEVNQSNTRAREAQRRNRQLGWLAAGSGLLNLILLVKVLMILFSAR